MKRSEVRGLIEVVALLTLTFCPIYISTFVIDRLSSGVGRGVPLWAAVIYFTVAPFVWIVASEVSGVFAKILGATILQGRRGSKYLGEVLDAALSVLCLALLEYVYFSDFFSAFAAAAMACLLYKAAEPVCYRLFPSLKEPSTRKG